MLTGVRWGGVTALDSYEGTLSDGSYGYADQFYTPEFTVDLGVTYAFSDKLSLTVGGNNIFNQYPEIQRNENRGFYLYSNYQQGSNDLSINEFKYHNYENILKKYIYNTP